MKISIQALTGMHEKYNFDVESSITIQRLKELFLEKSGDDKDLQTMSFAFKELKLDEDEKTLADYNIQDRSTLDLLDFTIIDRSGLMGTKFVDLSNNKGLKRQSWSTKGPRWRVASPGLCLEGLCTYNQCDAYNQRVVISIGYKKFDILLDTNENTTKCPVCERYVDPEICAFNNCWWKYEGIKQDEVGKGKPPKKFSCDWQQADNAYHYFDEHASGIVMWRQLIIEAVKNRPQ